MSDYIERDAAIASVCCDCSATADCRPGERCADYMRIKELPAADVAPVRHGLWLTKEYMYGDPAVGVPDAWVDRRAEQSDDYAWCSLCGGDAPFTSEASLILSDWCPNCGAKMDGGTE